MFRIVGSTLTKERSFSLGAASSPLVRHNIPFIRFENFSLRLQKMIMLSVVKTDYHRTVTTITSLVR